MCLDVIPAVWRFRDGKERPHLDSVRMVFQTKLDLKSPQNKCFKALFINKGIQGCYLLSHVSIMRQVSIIGDAIEQNFGFATRTYEAHVKGLDKIIPYSQPALYCK